MFVGPATSGYDDGHGSGPGHHRGSSGRGVLSYSICCMVLRTIAGALYVLGLKTSVLATSIGLCGIV
jgi:hypothetical protein